MMVITLQQIGSTKPWVARILGRHERFGFDRNFVSGITDRSHANSTGSRGVWTTYELHDGCYEIISPESWQRTERYFAIKDGKLERSSAKEVLEHLDRVCKEFNEAVR